MLWYKYFATAAYHPETNELFTRKGVKSPNLLLFQDPIKSPPDFLFTCQTGVVRTNLAIVLSLLVLYYSEGRLQRQDLSQPTKCLTRDQFQIIQTFIDIVPKDQPMEEESTSISLCSEMHAMKEAITKYKRKPEGMSKPVSFGKVVTWCNR